MLRKRASRYRNSSWCKLMAEVRARVDFKVGAKSNIDAE
ncbi:GTP cyclohydrolase, partial [Vibrio cholerae]